MMFRAAKAYRFLPAEAQHPISKLLITCPLLRAICGAVVAGLMSDDKGCDPEFVSLLNSLDGRTVLEVGANKGNLTRFICKSVSSGKVVALEPNPLAFQVARHLL